MLAKLKRTSSKKKSRRKNADKINVSSLASIGQLWRSFYHMPLAKIIQKLDYSCRTLYYRSPLYAFIEQNDPPVTELLHTGPDLWPGSPAIGQEVLKNFFTFQGRKIHMGKAISWAPKGANKAWLFDLHSFHWLADLRATRDPQALIIARDHIKDWVTHHKTFHKVYWHPFPLSRRLHHWLTHSAWLLEGADSAWKKAFLESLTQQANHLPKVLEWHVEGYRFIKNLKAQIFVSLCLPSRQSAYLEAADLLKKQLEKQILPDGLHNERSPFYHAMVLKDLLDIHAMIIKAGQTPGAFLDETIDSMATVLAFFRHPDGSLALFNGSTPGDIDLIDALQERCGFTETIPAELPYGGYCRLESGHICTLVDTGHVHTQNTRLSHAGTLSFELSWGGEHVFTNSGSKSPFTAENITFRQTEAHNTVSIGHQSSTEIWGDGNLGRRPKNVKAAVRQELGLGIGAEASHDGYRHLGIKHIRRLFINNEGTDLRGEDILERKKTKNGPIIHAHFHLHPSVQYKLRNTHEAEITLPSGEVLSFLTKGGQLFDAPALYCPDQGTPQKASKLVIRGAWQKEKCVLNWAIRRKNK